MTVTAETTAQRWVRMPWTRDEFTDEQCLRWLASREEAGRKIDVEMCEMGCWVADHAHPYGMQTIDGKLHPAQFDYTDKFNFVRSPDSDGWVCESDLPHDKINQFYDRIKRESERSRSRA